jgi:hypothetical protein
LPDDDEEVDDEDDEDDDEGLEVLVSIPDTFLRANAGAGLSGTRHSAVTTEEKESMQKRSAPSPGGQARSALALMAAMTTMSRHRRVVCWLLLMALERKA